MLLLYNVIAINLWRPTVSWTRSKLLLLPLNTPSGLPSHLYRWFFRPSSFIKKITQDNLKKEYYIFVEHNAKLLIIIPTKISFVKQISLNKKLITIKETVNHFNFMSKPISYNDTLILPKCIKNTKLDGLRILSQLLY